MRATVTIHERFASKVEAVLEAAKIETPTFASAYHKDGDHAVFWWGIESGCTFSLNLLSVISRLAIENRITIQIHLG